jgi:hypothetical protein
LISEKQIFAKLFFGCPPFSAITHHFYILVKGARLSAPHGGLLQSLAEAARNYWCKNVQMERLLSLRNFSTHKYFK